MASSSRYAGMSNIEIVEEIIRSRTVDGLNGCNEMKGSICKNGYAKLTVKQKNTWAHRMIYQLLNGEVPSCIDICHICDNRCCINPEHLFASTRLGNMQDAVKKGRQAKGLKLPHAKLNEKSKYEIVVRAMAGELYKNIAKDFGICKQHAGRISIEKGVRRNGIGK